METNRILSITIHNIKNVKNGTLDFCENENVKNGIFCNNAGILGLYGQNGSGKTTIIKAFALLQHLAINRKLNNFNEKGERIPSKFDYILDLEENDGFIEYVFLIFCNKQPYLVKYKLELYREKDNIINKISKESLSVTPFSSEGKTKFKGEFAPLEFDFKVNNLSYLYDGIKHETEKVKIKSSQINDYTLINSRKIASIEAGSSVIFSEEVQKYLINNNNEKVKTLGNVIYQLKEQLGGNLYIYDNEIDSLFNVGLGSIFGVYTDKEKKIETHGKFFISNYSFEILEENKPIYDSFIEQINIFISSFVPNFKAKIKKISERIDENGKKTLKVSIFRSVGPNEMELPLSEESSGIKKLFSISCALVHVYGCAGAWLIVDEFDSGVFEKLLGQILSVIQEKGKGQILFTAHNLRPLESINSQSIVFTTNNPNNRYIRFPKSMIKDGSNLRSLYLRALAVGGIKEELSSDVEEYEIDYALYKAFDIIKMPKE